MVRGLYTSALGMISQMQRMDVVTNNIANVDTTGYKKDQTVSQSFTEVLMKRLNDPGPRLFAGVPNTGKMSLGVFVDDVYTDFSSGSLRRTDSSLDLAVIGQGFFCVMSTAANGELKELYSRDGAFGILPDGLLVTKDGGVVQGLNGAVYLPNGIINIDGGGRIYSNDVYIDTLKMVNFEDLHMLRKLKDNYYTTEGEPAFAPYSGQIAQGFIENSNVSTVREMVELITLNRAYEANSRMITIHDQTLGRAVGEIARK